MPIGAEAFPGSRERREESEHDLGEKLKMATEALGEEIGPELEKDGIIIDRKSCRIDPRCFKDIYPEDVLRRDDEYVRKRKKEFYGDNLAQKAESSGEDLEKLKTIILHKKIGADFLVVRSSEYDDFKNGVDNLIIDKKTGNIVCAFDEKTENLSAMKKRAEDVVQRNLKDNGIDLRYGIKYEPEVCKTERGREVKMRIKKQGGIKNVPLFYLTLSGAEVEKGIRELDSSNEETILKRFVDLLKFQADVFESLSKYNTNQALKNRFVAFKKFLGSLTERKSE